jgi:hypothetical protein
MKVLAADPNPLFRGLNVVETVFWLQQVVGPSKTVQVVVRNYLFNQPGCYEAGYTDGGGVTFTTSPACFGAPAVLADGIWRYYDHNLKAYLIGKITGQFVVPGFNPPFLDLSSNPNHWVIGSGLDLASEQQPDVEGTDYYAIAVFDEMIIDVLY